MEASHTAMQLIRQRAFVTTPWINGGGITHEIARHDLDNKMVWRLSIAEVDRDGAFSMFEGMERILTVIEGNGMDLVVAEKGETRAALLHRPVSFSGDLKIEGRLRDGPCRDFNLIFDPSQVAASVGFLTQGAALNIAGPTGARTGIFCICGQVACNGNHQLEPGDFCFLTPGSSAVKVGPDGRALLIAITPT